MAGWKDRLFAATSNNDLLTRPADGDDAPWRRIGHAIDVVAMTSDAHMLYCVTKDGILWRRDPAAENIDWTRVDFASEVIAIAAHSKRLFGATRDNKLLLRGLGS